MYYRGDYTRGGYYRGDPWIGGLIGGAARALGVGKLAAKAGRWVAGRISGGTVKAATAVVAGTVATGVGTAIVNRAMSPDPIEMAPIEMSGGGYGGGGGGGTQVVVTASGRRMRVRWSATKQKWVAVRSLNPLNPKALNRALRRATGFEKFAKKTMNALYKTSGGTKVRKFKKATRRAS